ncbi:MAG: UDP-N-acetylmuramyl peptide synthase, partial [Firmicutes bacterium]|nr:UDP-N-acetylmuramyl peptide synthase [Bacillota bacterium]
KAAFEAEGKRIGYLSTIDTYDGIDFFESHLTTPEALVLHRHFANARQAKLDAFVMEVSSQALKYKRTDRVIFDIGLFLNFGKDHIGKGEHESEEDYFKSKLKLMSQCKAAIINKESARADEIIAAAKASPVCEEIIAFSEKETPVEYPIGIPGSFNRENALAAILVLRKLGISEESIKKALLETKVPGRMEVFKSDARDVICISDYAHSTLSFEKLFAAVKEDYPDYRIEILFGCPGGKGLSRREDLPKAAAKYVDFAWITEEDPGLESAEEICKVIKENLDKLGVESRVIVDRSEAIKTSIEEAKPGTVIVMTGKGREEYMHRGNEFPAWPSEVSQIERYLK